MTQKLGQELGLGEEAPRDDKPTAEAIPLFHGDQNQCFACSPSNPVGLKLEFSILPDLSSLAHPVLPIAYEGPPGYLHGGVIATVLDEAMSKANHAHGGTAMTRQLTIEYLRPVPSATAIRVTGRVLREEGRKRWAEAAIESMAGVVLAKASGLFIVLGR